MALGACVVDTHKSCSHCRDGKEKYDGFGERNGSVRVEIFSCQIFTYARLGAIR